MTGPLETGGGTFDPADLPWRRPLGAVPVGDGETEFRVWAPDARAVAVAAPGAGAAAAGGREWPLAEEGLGVYAGRAPVPAGADYWLMLDPKADAAEEGGRRRRLPDPASREQARGLRGPSRVLDPGAFAWTDAGFATPGLESLVLYELHVGTFTDEGTFDAAIGDLPRLAGLGINAIELMPVADFPGMRGWGYDGVYISAAHRAYGGPAGLQRLVDAAHAAGIAVILDVVYNHLGASGVKAFEPFGPYFTERYETFWGKAMNYDDSDSDPVREWVLQSAEGWIRDFHLDGLRLDAIHAIFDTGARPIVAEIVERVHGVNPRAVVIAESGLNDPKVIRPPAAGGWGCDGQWADDFHHALRVLLTGERDGYYAEFGTVADLAKAFGRPFVHDGRYSSFRRRTFGAPAGDRPPAQFVVFDQNHDQVGNRAFGDRLPAEARPLAAFCTLLSPFTPMLFMGEEYGEDAPFQFFCDHIDKRIATATREGRRKEFAAFASFGEEVPDPQAVETFEHSKLTRRVDARLAALYARLLEARRSVSGEARGIEFDEAARWLRLERDGGVQLVCNFGSEPRSIPTGRTEILLATHETTRLGDGEVTLEPLAGALLG
ncbi:MAG: maltooligosyltrehalose trehalohydrolase [Solirubrobacteraceae bacterium]|nr:maltooligosyltrehalose trehalohydrolase [Solirubrobacteraceae bacterium]